MNLEFFVCLFFVLFSEISVRKPTSIPSLISSKTPSTTWIATCSYGKKYKKYLLLLMCTQKKGQNTLHRYKNMDSINLIYD